MKDDFLVRIIDQIYDCAVEPEGWTDALTAVRDRLDLAYLSLHVMNFPPAYPRQRQQHQIMTTEWDAMWMQEVVKMTPHVPGFDQILAKDLDEPTTQLRHVPEWEFVETRFYREWVAPQGLRDSCHVNVIQRGSMTAQVIGATRKSRDLLSERDLALLGTLAPHMRRALIISDLLDEKRSQMKIYQSLLDHLSVAAFLVSRNSEIVYCNEAGSHLLSTRNFISGYRQRLAALSPIHSELFRQALQRASSGDAASLGLLGNGMVLPGTDGGTAIAYILPLGASEIRHSLGDGLAAVLISTDSAAQLPMIEILTAMTGMTVSEARVALGIADGQSVDEIAAAQGIAPNTVRKHLANAFGKTNVTSQPSLGVFVNRLRMPLRRMGLVANASTATTSRIEA